MHWGSPILLFFTLWLGFLAVLYHRSARSLRADP